MGQQRQLLCEASREGEEEGFLGDSFDVSLGVGWTETWNVWQGAGLEIE